MAAVGLALLSATLYGIVDFGLGRAARAWPTLSVAATMHLVELVLGLALVLVLGGSFAGLGGWAWLAVLGGLTSTATILCLAQALSIGQMGVVGPITACSGLIPVGAAVVLGLQVTPAEAVGCGFCLAGVVVLAVEPRTSVVGVAHRSSVALALIALVSIGALTLTLAEASNRAEPIEVVTAMRAISATLLWGALLVRRRAVGVPARGVRTLAVLAALEFGAVASLAFAYAHGTLEVVGVLSSLYPVVMVVLARVLLAERLQRRQVLGGVAAVLGAAILGSSI